MNAGLNDKHKNVPLNILTITKIIY